LNNKKNILPFQNNSSEEVIEALFRSYYPVLCKSLFKILKDVSLAEDIVQEVFLKIWDMRADLKMNEGIKSYLYKACYNTALNHIKTEKRESELDANSNLLISYESAERSLNFLEAESQIMKAIELLPPKTQLVFTLSRFEELSYKEIAERLDVSVKSVEKHMGIALQRLRENLKELLISFILMVISTF
jgi:RNA polymerase sigma-70 factor, ECF subfamily